MTHLLIVELPGGNDSDILTAARDGGHRVSLLTADPDHYRAQAEVAALLDAGVAVIDAGGFAWAELCLRLEARHRADPFDAILCLQDLRIVEAARIAEALGLRHLNPATAALCRDKSAVRQRLAGAGIAQPAFAMARGASELLAAVDAIGVPLLIKPADGFGSQNVFALRTGADLAALRGAPRIIADAPGDYGLGVMADGAMLVERLMEGQLIGCDTLSVDGRHMLMGVNEKLMFPPPSFAIRGGCFTAHIGQFAEIAAHAFALLDAVGFDHGAAHIELMLTADGPRLVEINPRLVGARIARLISAARGRSVHADLIALHAFGTLPPSAELVGHAVTRWLAAPMRGVLEAITLPSLNRPSVATATLFARPGDAVTPPYDNADRLGCIVTHGPDRAAAEALAEEIVTLARVKCVHTSIR